MPLAECDGKVVVVIRERRECGGSVIAKLELAAESPGSSGGHTAAQTVPARETERMRVGWLFGDDDGPRVCAVGRDRMEAGHTVITGFHRVAVGRCCACGSCVHGA